jgi:hypothetical protein
VWAITRTVGIPFIDSLADVEGVGTQDLAAALFAAASVAAAVRMLAVPVARTTIAPVWAGALGIVALLAALPALQAEHAHGGDHTHLEAAGHGDDGHDHGDSAAGDDAQHAHDESDPEHGHDEGHDETAAGDDTEHADHEGATEGELAGHGHTATDGPAGHHDPTGTDPGTHPHPPTTDGPHDDHPDDPTTPPDHPHPPADPDDPDPTGPIISLDDPRVTPAQRAVAQSLIDGVKTSLTGKTVASIKAAGYQWIGDGAGGGYQHYVNWTYYSDGIEMNPAKIESIVVQNGKIVSGMYILNPGKTMNNTPALAGELTTWHDHQNLCFSGTTLVGLSVNGSCDPAKGGPGGTLTPTPPMLHVWLVPNPCGPFAGIESHGGSDCGTHDH